jgi:hypothetical protein
MVFEFESGCPKEVNQRKETKAQAPTQETRMAPSKIRSTHRKQARTREVARTVLSLRLRRLRTYTSFLVWARKAHFQGRRKIAAELTWFTNRHRRKVRLQNQPLRAELGRLQPAWFDHSAWESELSGLLLAASVNLSLFAIEAGHISKGSHHSPGPRTHKARL